MSQNDFNLANQGFPSVRSDMNSALQALASNSSGATEPATTYAYQWWYDTANNIMKIRNTDNDAWIDFATFDQVNDSWSFASVMIDGDLAVNVGALFVDAANGRVGIGTSSPESTSKVTVSQGTSQVAYMAHSGGSASYPAFGFAGQVPENGGRGAGMFSPVDGSIAFSTSATERLHINSSGNVIVGASTAVGSGKFGVDFGASGDGIAVANSTTGDRTAVAFYNANGFVGRISTTGSSTSYLTSSDYRLKEDVQPMVGASDRVLGLNPVNFAWKADGTRVDGFLAHETQAVVPEAVHGTKDEVDADNKPIYQGIDQSKLVPLLTAALQEALTEIAALKDRVAALEA